MKSTKYANMLIMAELQAAETRLTPFPVLNRLREQTPVRYDEGRQCWDLFRYEDVHRVLKDPAVFSSVRGMTDNQQSNLLFMDPPRHKQLRDLVNKAFTPKAVQELTPRIYSITEHLLAEISGDVTDITGALATPLPVIVIAELLGVPAEDRALFKHWSDVLVEGAENLTDEAFQAIALKRMKAVEELKDYFGHIIRERAANPQNDLISALLEAEIDGEKLSGPEILGFCILLLAAGNETTTNLITNSLRIMTEEPTLQIELSENPELIPGFIEEVLRYYPPITAIGRVAKEDVTVGEAPIHAGDQVMSWVAAANRDPSKFEEPDRFDLRRKPNPHLSFGFGIHFCLGAPLARLEGHIAIELLLKQFGELRRVPEETLTPIHSSFVFGVKHYPITFVRK